MWEAGRRDVVDGTGTAEEDLHSMGGRLERDLRERRRCHSPPVLRTFGDLVRELRDRASLGEWPAALRVLGELEKQPRHVLLRWERER